MKKALLMTCLLAACRTTSTAPEPQRMDPEGPDLPAQWLVWSTIEGGAETRRIETDGKGGFRDLGRADGAWIGVPDGEKAKMWQFVRETVPATVSDCDCEMEAINAGQEPNCEQPSQVEIGLLRAFPAGPELRVPPDDTHDSETREIFPVLDGSVGPYVFTKACLEQYACGAAHGDTMCAQMIYDLRNTRIVDEYEMAAAPLRGPQMLQFVQEAYDDEHEAAELAEEDVEFSWVAPRYENTLIPRMEEQYTGPACYACSDGNWDSYTISSRRTADLLPTLLAAWLKENTAPPEPFAAHAKGHIGGWSVVPQDVALRKQLDAVFTP